MSGKELQAVINSLIETSNENGIDNLTSLATWLPTLFKVYNKYHNTTDARIHADIHVEEIITTKNERIKTLEAELKEKDNDQALLIDAKNGCIETLEIVLKEKDKTILYWQNYTGN